MTNIYLDEDKNISNAWNEVMKKRAEAEKASKLEEEETSRKLKGLFENIGKSREKFKKEGEALRVAEQSRLKEAEKQKKIELIKTRWKLACVPEGLRKSSLKTFIEVPVETQDKIDFLNQRKVIEILSSFDCLASNSVFHGFYGLGKSYLASFFVRKVIVEGLSAGFVSASDYIRFCKQDLVRAERMEQMSFLVLDEVGNSDIASWDLVHLKDLIIRRDNKGLKTLITTNLTVNQLRAYLKGTAQDRMLNASTVYVDFNQVDGACSLRGRV